MRLAIFSAAVFAVTIWSTDGCAAERLDPDTFFCAAEPSERLPVLGKDCDSAQRVASTVDRVLRRANPRVAAGLHKQGVSLYVIDNEEELDPEYYPVSDEEMSRFDPALVAFLDRVMSGEDKEAKP